jgi:hypothetical protein
MAQQLMAKSRVLALSMMIMGIYTTKEITKIIKGMGTGIKIFKVFNIMANGRMTYSME